MQIVTAIRLTYNAGQASSILLAYLTAVTPRWVPITYIGVVSMQVKVAVVFITRSTFYNHGVRGYLNRLEGGESFTFNLSLFD